MIKSQPSKHIFFRTRRALTTCSVPLDPSDIPASPIPSDHESLCFSLTEQLLRRGLFSSAKQVIQRIIKQSLSVSSAISIVDFAASRGLELELGSYSALLRKLVDLGQPQLAEELYNENVVVRGIHPDASILNSMVVCFCRLGKLEEAKRHSDSILSLNYVPSRASFGALLEELCARDKILEAFDYFVTVNNTGVFLGFRCFNVLMDGLCYKGYMDEALQLFDIMRTRNRSPLTLHLYKTLFYGLCKRGWFVEAESLFGEMESHGLYIDKVMYTSLIHEYSKDKKMKMAMRVFLRMLKTCCDPDNYTCNTLIHGFVKLGLFEKGWVVYNQMLVWGIEPDVVTYHIMISSYCQEGKPDCAFMLLNNMVSCNLTPSIHSYTVLIDALHKEKRFVEAGELYQSLLDIGVVPDHVLFFTTMKMCPKGHELQWALIFLQTIVRNGCGFEFDSPDFGSLSSEEDLQREIEYLLGEIVTRDLNLANMAFGVIISALCESGKTDDALNCLGEMMSLGCKPLPFTFNSLIKCLCKEGLFKDAMSLIDHMQECAVMPDLATYLIIVNELCKQGDLVSASDVLDQMNERGVRPNIAIYASIIGCLIREKRIFDAESLLKRMLEDGVDPDENVYKTMIAGYSKIGKLVEAQELFGLMMKNSVRPSSHSYTALISGLVKKNMTEKGCIYLGKMFRDGIEPNVVLYTSLISHFLKKGEFKFAFRLVDLMDRSRIKRDQILYIELVSGVCRNILPRKERWDNVYSGTNRAKEMLFLLLSEKALVLRENKSISAISPEEMKSVALRLIQEVKEVNSIPNLYLYNAIISGLCRIDRIEDAYYQLDLMQREGVLPNQVTFTILMDGHIHCGDIGSAVGVFNKMNSEGLTPDNIAYNTLLRGLCGAGRVIDALSLSYTMHKRGFIPNTVSYSYLLSCLCAGNLSDHAFKIFEEMIYHKVLPRWDSHKWLFGILCEQNKLCEARLVFDLILERGKTLDGSTKEASEWINLAVYETRKIPKDLHSN